MNTRSITLFGIGFVLLAAALFGGDSNDPKLSGIDVKFEDVDVKLLLSTKIATLYTNQLQESENPNCRAAAVLVSQEAVDQYSYWAKFVDLWKKVTDKVKDGADLVGAKTVSRVAQLAGTIVECFDDQEPAAAFGRAIVDEGADWLKDQIPKTNNKPLDDAIKDQANKAKEKLSQALFPGKTEKAKDFGPVGGCDVKVVPEFEWPGPKGKGGLRVFVDGDCKCKKPLKLAAHGAGTGQVVNSGLGQFKLIVFLPLERMESDVSYGGKAINLKKYLETGSKLKKEIQNALNGKENKESPVDLAKELQDQTGKLTDGIKATLVLRPVFEKQIRIEELKIMSCDNCGQKPSTTGQGTAPTETTQPPRNVDEEICGSRCFPLWETWFHALNKFLDEKKPDNPATKGLSEEIRQKRIRLQTLRERLTTSQQKLAAQRPDLEKNIEEYKQRAEGLKEDGRREVEKMVQRLRDGLQNLEREVTVDLSRVEQESKELSKLESEAGAADAKLRDLEEKADSAKAAYYACAKCCWDEAKMGNANVKVRKDIQDWGKEHPIDCCLIGTWRSVSLVGPAGQRGGSGIIMTIEGDGKITMDYTNMQSLEAEKGNVGPAKYDNFWKGTAQGYISTNNGAVTVVSVEKSELSGKTVVQGRTTEKPFGKNLGPGYVRSGYKCDKTTLTWTSAAEIFTFKREEKK